LNWNNQVWTLFADDCGTARDQPPRELRAAIVNLGIWVKKETAAALNRERDLEALIAVNRDIMKGLRNSAASSELKAKDQDAPPTSGLIIDSA